MVFYGEEISERTSQSLPSTHLSNPLSLSRCSVPFLPWHCPTQGCPLPPALLRCSPHSGALFPLFPGLKIPAGSSFGCASSTLTVAVPSRALAIQSELKLSQQGARAGSSGLQGPNDRFLPSLLSSLPGSSLGPAQSPGYRLWALYFSRHLIPLPKAPGA